MRTAYLVVAFALGITAGFVARGRTLKPATIESPETVWIMGQTKSGKIEETFQVVRSGLPGDSSDVADGNWRIVFRHHGKTSYFEGRPVDPIKPD